MGRFDRVQVSQHSDMLLQARYIAGQACFHLLRLRAWKERVVQRLGVVLRGFGLLLPLLWSRWILVGTGCRIRCLVRGNSLMLCLELMPCDICGYGVQLGQKAFVLGERRLSMDEEILYLQLLTSHSYSG